MRKKLLNVLVIIVMTTVVILSNFNISIASTDALISSAQGESGPMPPPPTPGDSSGGGSHTPSLVEKHGDITVYEYYHTGIKGNAYENLGINIGKQGKDSISLIKTAIQYVKVELFKASDNPETDSPVKTTYTDSNGGYQFLNITPGNYKVKFTYGLVEDIDSKSLSNVNEIKRIIKYNGQDYMVESVGGSSNETYVAQTYSIDKTIKACGAGCAQVFLAIDCSQSMRATTIEVDGVEKTMLQAEIDAAKKMINSLLDGKKNIYIGIVAFSGDAYRAVSLTDNIAILEHALKEIDEGNWYVANTDVAKALKKAKESFSNNDENSNRYIMLLSDGIPTKFGTEQVYCDETAEETYNKLLSISEKTRDYVSELKEEGINVYGVFVSNSNDTEDNFVRNIFQDNCSEFYLESDINTILYKINQSFQKYIIETIKDNENYTEMGDYSYSISGKEDSNRREEVDNNYSQFDYSNTIDFSAINMDVDSMNWNDFKQKANNVSTKAYMTAITDVYVIEPKGTDWVETKTDTYQDYEDGELVTISYEYKVYHVYVPILYEKQDLLLNNRGVFTLVPTITATGLRVTASNLQVLKTIAMTDKTIPLVAYLEPKLIYGSRVDIEYTVSVRNDSPIYCKTLEMIVNVPDGFSYTNKVAYVTGKPGDLYTIENVSTTKLYYDGYVNNKWNGKDAVVLKSKDGFYIAPGQRIEMRFIVSKLISTDQEDSTYDVSTEVLKYSNTSSRRMQFVKPTTSKVTSEYPGNYNLEETDYAESTNLAMVIPPTGAENKMIYVFMAVVTLTILVVGMNRLKRKNK